MEQTRLSIYDSKIVILETRIKHFCRHYLEHIFDVGSVASNGALLFCTSQKRQFFKAPLLLRLLLFFFF